MREGIGGRGATARCLEDGLEYTVQIAHDVAVRDMQHVDAERVLRRITSGLPRGVVVRISIDFDAKPNFPAAGRATD